VNNPSGSVAYERKKEVQSQSQRENYEMNKKRNREKE